MSKSKNMVESFLETQTKAVNNWVETTKKMQQAFIEGQGATKSADLYNEWLQNQLSIFKNITLESQMENKENNHDFFMNWYKQQAEFIKEMSSKNMEWMQHMMNWDNNKEMQTRFHQMNESWSKMYQNWENTLTETFKNLSSNMQHSWQKEVFRNVFSSNKMFLNMFETFQPFMNAFNQPANSMENIKKMMTPEFYKEMTEKMFSNWFPKHDMATGVMNYMNQMNEMNHQVFASYKNMMDNMKDNMGQMPNMKYFSEVFGNGNPMMELYEKTVAPYAKLMNPENETEMAKRMVEFTDKYSSYAIKQAQMQYMLYSTTQKAMEKTMENMMGKVKENTEFNSFSTFFNEWVSITEKEFLALFNSDDFSTLKSDILTLSSGLKKEMETSMEQSMSKMPLVFKSHLDEIYKNLYDLKKIVKDIKKHIDFNEMEEVIAEENIAAAKTTSKSKKK